MQMAEAVILSVVIKIGVALGNETLKQASLRFQNFNTQLTDLQGRMGRIRVELRLMHGFLGQVDIQNLKNRNYGIWVEELRMLAHRIEDIVDEYLYLVGHKHDIGWGAYLRKGCKKTNLSISLNRIASMVKEEEVNLVHLFQARSRWVSLVDGGNSCNSSGIIERSQHLASISRSLGEEELVGVDENRGQLEQWLLPMDLLHYVVIVLYGMGGLGKTVLAANVYRKEREKFDCHAWVSISQTYSTKDVLKCLITELYRDRQDIPDNINNMGINDLQHAVSAFLNDKKYLIILDDVWSPEAFGDLFGALVHNNMQSRLVITTRQGKVCALASPERILALTALPEDKALDLFCKKAFPRHTNHKCPAEFNPLSEEIVKKCRGLPLALVSVGSLLRVREKSVEEWRKINDQLSWELINNPRLHDIRNILHLSYIYLPAHLKSCFLYCSLFPEDYIFQRKQLARLWIAEGFIEGRGASTLEEVAEEYMKELVHRNMLQLVERNSFGRIKKFRMHDIIRELAVDLCQNVYFGVAYDEDKCGGYLEKVGRRLVVHKLKKDIEQAISRIHHLRSIAVMDNSMPSLTLLSVLSKMSRYMTVLELSGLPIEKIPDAIGDLFNLCHLGLRNSKVKMLPESIDKLSNLMTLDLHNSDIQKLPGGIVKLKKLRHLFAQKFNDPSGRVFQWSSGVSILKGLGELANLQTLQALVLEDESVKQLGELTQLRSLRLVNVKEIYCGRVCGALAQMQFLSTLHVNVSDENERLMLNALPAKLQKLCLRGPLDVESLKASPLFQAGGQNLHVLGLNWSGLMEDSLPFISRLTNLTELFFTNAYNGGQLVFRDGWLPNLKTLQLRDLPHLERLDIEQGAMVTLEKLLLANLNSMKHVPSGIQFLVTLQHLYFLEIRAEFLELLRQFLTNGDIHPFRYSLQARLMFSDPQNAMPLE
uniref:NB-ARC domain-containing protein n=2 Tax=Hordeum vulgare subsp. vulgare TaxID=112509 RepID=A0A287EGN3_HORVV